MTRVRTPGGWKTPVQMVRAGNAWKQVEGPPPLPVAPTPTVEYSFRRAAKLFADQLHEDAAGRETMQLGNSGGSDTRDPTWTEHGLRFTGSHYTRNPVTPFRLPEQTILVTVNAESLHSGVVFTESDNLLLRLTSGGLTRFEYTRADATVYGADGPAYAANSWFIFSARKLSTAGVRFSVNKTYTTASAETTDPSIADSHYRFGSSTAGSSYLRGTVARFKHFNRALSDAEFDLAYERLIAELAAQGIALDAAVASTAALPALKISVAAPTTDTFRRTVSVAGHLGLGGVQRPLELGTTPGHHRPRSGHLSRQPNGRRRARAARGVA